MNVPKAATFVRDRTGLVFSDARRDGFESAMAAAMKRACVRDVDDYLARLVNRPELLDDLVADITVGETYFFRDRAQLDLIRTTMLPDLLARRPANHRLRIWSAGCASGEEPYTLAIIARELALDPPPHILATDLSRAALKRAARARYGRWSLRGVAQEVVARYFERKDDVFELAPALRSMVEFGYLNLAEDTYPSLATGVWGMDVVYCRNVLMYFDRETAVRVARRLLDSLAHDGWLVLGASDPLIGELVACDVVLTDAGLVYRRAEASRASRPIQPLPLPLSAAAPPAAPPPAAPQRPLPAPAFQAPAQTSPARHRTVAERIADVRSLANRGDLEDAGRVCATALDVHRDSAELHYLHAVLLANAGRHADAARAARAALYLDRELIVAHIVLGNAAALAGDTASARRALRNAERLLGTLPEDALVPASDGEPAGRLAEMVRTRLALLTGMAA